MVLLLKNLLFTLLVPATVALYVPLLLTHRQPLEPGSHVALATALFLLGAAVYAWCVWDFATFGRGTPAPIDAPKRLVVRGLYRYTRNPMYVGVLTAILGWATLYLSPALALYALGIWCFFELFILAYEEPQLRRKFGRDYADYCRRVGRWLPRLSRSA